jgi:HEAT repeat protein
LKTKNIKNSFKAKCKTDSRNNTPLNLNKMDDLLIKTTVSLKRALVQTKESVSRKN